jgi:hypothetical protein
MEHSNLIQGEVSSGSDTVFGIPGDGKSRKIVSEVRLPAEYCGFDETYSRKKNDWRSFKTGSCQRNALLYSFKNQSFA